MPDIAVGCSAVIGQGGLGNHLDFIYRAALTGGSVAAVFCREAPAKSGITGVANARWQRWQRYSPLRWLPASRVYLDCVQFDGQVSVLLPKRPIVYHTFPGYALSSFKQVRKMGGTAVLEAATTHVSDLYGVTMEEHRMYNVGGSPYSNVWVDRALREYELADYITVASRLQWESFVNRGFPEQKLLFAPLGVDTHRFAPDDDQPSLQPRGKNEKFRIIMVGQVSMIKGFIYLLDAAEQLKDREIEVILFGGIGWRPLRQIIERYRNRGLNIRLDAGDPVPALKNAHLCVHPSISDGFGLAPLEAMGAGLATIVTDATGMKDAVVDRMNGFIIPARNTRALAACIAEIKANDDYRIQMAKAARMVALQYEREQKIAQYAKVLKPVWNRN